MTKQTAVADLDLNVTVEAGFIINLFMGQAQFTNVIVALRTEEQL